MLVLRGEFGLAKKPRSTFDNSPALPESLPDFNGCPSVNHMLDVAIQELENVNLLKKEWIENIKDNTAYVYMKTEPFEYADLIIIYENRVF